MAETAVECACVAAEEPFSPCGDDCPHFGGGGACVHCGMVAQSRKAAKRKPQKEYPTVTEQTKKTEPESWAIVELMGHVKLAGRLTEEERFGVKMGRLDIPNDDGFVTQYFGGGSVYRITAVTEEVARQVCKTTAPAPVSPWDFPKQLPEPAATSASIHDALDEDDPGDVDADDLEPHRHMPF